MVVICCFQCEPRFAVYVISVMSFLHFSAETALLVSLDEDHRLVSEDDGVKFYTVFFTHIFLLLSTVLLFCSALFMNKMLCLPWLIGCTFNIMLSLAVLMVIFIRILNGFEIIELEKAVFIVFAICVTVYCMWIVLSFFYDPSFNFSSDAEYGSVQRSTSLGNKPVFTLYDEEDEDGGGESALQRSRTNYPKGVRSAGEERVALIDYSLNS